MRAFLWLIIFNFICVPAPQVKPVQTGSSQPQPVPYTIQPATPIQPATLIQYAPIKSIPLSPIVSQPVQRLSASTPQTQSVSPIISQPIQRSQSVQTLYASSPQQQSGVNGRLRSQSVIAQSGVNGRLRSQSGVNGRLRSQFVAPQTQISQPVLYQQQHRQSIAPPPPGTLHQPQIYPFIPQQQPGADVLSQMRSRLGTASQGLAQLQDAKTQLQGVKSQASQAIGQLKKAGSVPEASKRKVKMTKIKKPKMRRTKSRSNLNSKKKSKTRRAYTMLFPIVIILFCVLCCSLCVIINVCWASMIGIISSFVFDKIRRNREFYESGDDIHAYSVVKIQDC